MVFENMEIQDGGINKGNTKMVELVMTSLIAIAYLHIR